MKQATRFSVQPGWKLLITDMGYNPVDVLTHARLPTDLFVRKEASLTPVEYFRLWDGLEQAAGSDELPLQLGQAISVEAFDPALFACLCSPNLNTALQRLAQYKRLIGPLAMELDIAPKQTTVTLSCRGHNGSIPRSLSTTELVFLTQLSRLATRERIVPLALLTTNLPGDGVPYEAYFGRPLRKSDVIQIAFTAEDARRPFLTENAAMWMGFEPGLRRRLSEMDGQASIEDRVRGVLLEMLPAGQSSMEEVAERLTMSRRSLQRHLRDESVGFQDLLGSVRQDLAQHYLLRSSMSSGEISWLLGFQESNSFVRAFRAWTGTTPGAYRSGHASGASASR